MPFNYKNCTILMNYRVTARNFEMAGSMPDERSLKYLENK